MRWIFVFIVLFSKSVIAQNSDDDSLYSVPIELEQVEVYSLKPRLFSSEEERKQYYILRYRVQKVYKYARLAAERLKIMQETIDTMSNSSMKKIYIKRTQKYIEDRFTEELKKLSQKQGQILVKLIHRQTGSTAYNLVKDLRSGWSAFWYNNTAWFYNISLKKVYDPYSVKEDFYIEDILQRSFQLGELEYQKSAFPIDFSALQKKWGETL